jgi:DNA-binding HxlR family transcriptional regulator
MKATKISGANPMDKSTSALDSACPMSRALERVGEVWSTLILRDAFDGLKRFDQFEQSLGIAPNILTRRLQMLVTEGLLERRQYCAHPPRFEYVLTQCGRDYWPVLLSLMAWGIKHFSPGGAAMFLVDSITGTGATVNAVLVDAANGKALNERDHFYVARPAATEGMQQRLAKRAAHGASAPDAARRCSDA